MGPVQPRANLLLQKSAAAYASWSLPAAALGIKPGVWNVMPSRSQPIRRCVVVEKPSEVPVSKPKTKPTEGGVESHIAAIANEEQRNDAQTLIALMQRVTKQEPRMWGPSIVGFGSYHYKYASGHEGDSALTGFAARGRELVVYIAADFEGRDVLLARLGPHRTGKACVYIRLANVDLKVLETLVARSVAETKLRYPEPDQGDA